MGSLGGLVSLDRATARHQNIARARAAAAPTARGRVHEAKRVRKGPFTNRFPRRVQRVDFGKRCGRCYYTHFSHPFAAGVWAAHGGASAEFMMEPRRRSDPGFGSGPPKYPGTFLLAFR